mmetsp:Transcript_34915/g.64654  ORF Transcript_34915/g.64654 Transcript_34915/m.64654 type:complete len:92 (-) Transcript_34915:174-449(-)
MMMMMMMIQLNKSLVGTARMQIAYTLMLVFSMTQTDMVRKSFEDAAQAFTAMDFAKFMILRLVLLKFVRNWTRLQKGQDPQRPYIADSAMD